MNTARLLSPRHCPRNLSVWALPVRRCYTQDAPRRDHRASTKLFSEAAKEEVEEAEQAARTSRLAALGTKHENWTGEESMQDAVLRMLVDKYKPLRSGPIRTADEKLKKAPPSLGTTDIPSQTRTGEEHVSDGSVVVQTTWGASTRSMADVPLLPSVEGHQPWHTTFRVPSHAQSSVNYGQIPIVPSKTTASASSLLDDKARRQAKEAKKRTEHAGRLQSARESTIDYRLGLKDGQCAVRRRVNPVAMKGWASLVEDRIERARREGKFNNVQGRGQPLKQFTEERNPFIAREEFLMNRIVQRNGAAPPWIEIQGELDTALNSLRDVLRQSWTRRAIRMLTLLRPASHLPKLSLVDVTSWRDSEWESRERAYHETALSEINSLVRKYNGMAPYSVRRVPYALESELEKAYRESGEDILKGLAERVSAGPLQTRGTAEDTDEDNPVDGHADQERWAPVRIRDVIRQWMTPLLGSRRVL